MENNKSIVNEKNNIPTKPWWQRVLALCIIAILLFFGFSASNYLLKTKPKAEKKPPVKMETLVKTIQVSPTTTNVIIQAMGKVIPAEEIIMNARVSGEVRYLHPNLRPGGIIKKGEIVVRLDDTDFQLNLKQKEISLAKSQADLKIEQGSQTVAEKEWDLINKLTDDLDKSSKDLALRKPQLAKIMAAIEAAKADIDKARLELSRTEVKAPFTAVVRQKNVSLGNQISPQTSIATLTGTSKYWAELSLPADKVSWLKLPGKKSKGSPITIYSSQKTAYDGKILNLLPDLDKDGLMTRLLVEIFDPIGLKSGNNALPIDSFITAKIVGKKIRDIFKIPRSALHNSDTVYTSSPENTFETQKVKVLWKDSDWAYIKEGLNDNSRIIISNVPAPIENMPLKIVQ